MGVHRTRGEPNGTKVDTHPKNITTLPLIPARRYGVEGKLLDAAVTDWSARVLDQPDDPIFHHAGDGAAVGADYASLDYQLAFVEGGGPVPIVNLSARVTLVDPDGFEMIWLKMTRAAELSHELTWPPYVIHALENARECFCVSGGRVVCFP